MDATPQVEIIGGRGFCRPKGTVSLDEAVAVVDAALAFARDNGVRQLLVNITELFGFSSPSLFERLMLVSQWAFTAYGQVRLVIVARPEIIDPEKFGVTVAANRGMEGNIFDTEPEAVAWLDGELAK